MARQFNPENWNPTNVSIRTVCGPMQEDKVEIGKLESRMPRQYAGMDSSTIRALVMQNADLLVKIARACGIEPFHIANVQSVSLKDDTGFGVVTIILTSDCPIPSAVRHHYAIKGHAVRVQQFKNVFSHVVGNRDLPALYWGHAYESALAVIQGTIDAVSAQHEWDTRTESAIQAVTAQRTFTGKNTGIPEWAKEYVNADLTAKPMPRTFVGEYAKIREANESKRTMAELLPATMQIAKPKISENTAQAIRESERRLAKSIAESMNKRIRSRQGQKPVTANPKDVLES